MFMQRYSLRRLPATAVQPTSPTWASRQVATTPMLSPASTKVAAATAGREACTAINSACEVRHLQKLFSASKLHVVRILPVP